MRIRQGHLPGLMRHFPAFMTRYGLQPYRSATEPAVFFGVYNENQLRMIRDHRALGLIVWLGSDTPNLKRGLWKREAHRLRHVAIGPWIEEDLRTRGLEFRRVNLYGSPLLEELKPEPRGRGVYAYLPKKRDAFFRGNLIRYALEQLPADVEKIVHNGLQVAREDMPAVYRRAGCSIRVPVHDGGSESVVELGLMGRRSIFNGDLPCAIPWSRKEEIPELVLEELDAGPDPELVAEAVREHVEWGDGWLQTESWE